MLIMLCWPLQINRGDGCASTYMKRTRASRYLPISQHFQPCALITREPYWRLRVTKVRLSGYFRQTLENHFKSCVEVLRKLTSTLFVSIWEANGWLVQVTGVPFTSSLSSRNTITTPVSNFRTKKKLKLCKKN